MLTPDLLFSKVALAMGASWCAGINLYATLAVLGLLHRYAPGFQLSPELAVLANWWVIGAAALMYTIEFAADKIPAVDTGWDAIHTFIRVPAGAVLGASALGTVPFEAQVAAAILGGTLALGSHATKATTRVAAHTTGTSALVSPTVSLVEDGFVIGTLALLVANPLLGFGLVLATMLAAGYLMLKLWQVARVMLRRWRQGEFQMQPPADNGGSGSGIGAGAASGRTAVA